MSRAPTVEPASPELSRGGGRRGRSVVIAVLAVLLVVGGAAAFMFLRQGEAGSPSDLADEFQQAGVTCKDYDVIYDDRASKALGCRTDDAKIIVTTTYGSLPTADEWLTEKCTAAEGLSRRLRHGFYVMGDDFIIEINQLRHPGFVTPTPVRTTAHRLARVLDGTATRYSCDRG